MCEHKFTDEEIIKALECCQTQYERKCEDCPYEKLRKTYISVVTCESEMRKDLLAFVNRQKEKIQSAEKEKALKLIHEAIECGVLASQDNCVAVIFTDDNDEDTWHWMSIEDAAEDLVEQNAFKVLEEGIKKTKAIKLANCRDWSLDGILNTYFFKPEFSREASYEMLTSLVNDLESLGVLSDADGIISRLDEIDSGREY